MTLLVSASRLRVGCESAASANAAPRGVDKETSPPPNEGKARYEGADIVTASEARKVGRRLMCAADEIDRLSEQDWTAAGRADA